MSLWSFSHQGVLTGAQQECVHLCARACAHACWRGSSPRHGVPESDPQTGLVSEELVCKNGRKVIACELTLLSLLLFAQDQPQITPH